MGNEVNYVHTINFINLFYTQQDQGNLKKKAKSRKMGLQFFPINFHGCFSFILRQNAYHALILDHLKIINI